MKMATFRNDQGMSNDQMRRIAPSIFAEQPWSEVSSKYAFIPTIRVVERLQGEGFQLVEASQSVTRIPGKRDFAKHMLRFRNGSKPATIGGMVPEIVLVNSHDSTSAYKLMAGLFRMVCSNGMIVCAADMGSISVRHTGNITDDVIDGSFQVIEESTEAAQHMLEWQHVLLPAPAQLEFARAAGGLRWGDTVPVDPKQLLNARRYDDNGADLFHVVNRVQENVMKGGLSAERNAKGARQTTRAIAAVDANVRFNRDLWQLAENIASLMT